jgi:hypothetical protein
VVAEHGGLVAGITGGTRRRDSTGTAAF